MDYPFSTQEQAFPETVAQSGTEFPNMLLELWNATQQGRGPLSMAIGPTLDPNDPLNWTAPKEVETKPKATAVFNVEEDRALKEPGPSAPPKVEAPKPAEVPKKVTPKVTPAPAAPSKEEQTAITKTLLEEAEKPPTFPEMQWTPKYDYAGAIEKAYNAIPKTIGELVGEPPPQRPQAPVKPWWQVLTEGAGMGALGIDPVKVAREAQERRDKDFLLMREDYNKKIEYAREVRQAQTLGQITFAKAKQEETNKTIDDEKKAYAQLGLENPTLAKNVNYRAGLYKDLPENIRQKLLADAIDPATGEFKPNSALYIDPVKKEKLVLTEKGQVLQALFPGRKFAPQEILLYSTDNKAFLTYLNDGEKQLTNNIIEWSKDPAKNATAIKNAQLTLLRVSELKTGIAPDLEADRQIEFYRRKYQEDLAGITKALARGQITPQRAQEEVKIAGNLFEDRTSYAIEAVNPAGLAAKTQEKIAGLRLAAKTKEEEENPEYKEWDFYYPILNSKKLDKKGASEAFGDLITAHNAAKLAPVGTNVDLYVQKNAPGYAYGRFRDLRDSMVGNLTGVYGLVVRDAIAQWGGLSNVPWANINAAAIIAKNQPPASKDQIIATLLAGYASKGKPTK